MKFPTAVSLTAGLFIAAFIYQQVATTANQRHVGRMAAQTAYEERSASTPLGSGPTFTTDWVSGTLDKRLPELSDLIGKPGVRGLEIGSFEGRSAIWFAQHVLTVDGSTLTCVDLFGPRIDEFFDHNVSVSGVAPKIIKMKGASRDVLRTLEPDSYDFVYVDGCHLATCAIEDMVLSWQLLKLGGVMIVDDYGWSGPELERPAMAVDAFLNIYEPAVNVIARDHQVSFRKIGTGY